MTTFTIDTLAAGRPFPHYWELCVGSCHAVMGLRADWRAQLEKCRRELGFLYVRFHGLLDDAMSVCLKDADGRLRYSFFNVDSIFDFLLSIGMKPFIELGFMPTALASGAKTCFHYRANITPPAEYGLWAALIEALTRHLADRYGIDEVRTWFFEVWNEPNLEYFWAGTQADYFKLYLHAARAVKSVDARLRVGGPATSVNAWIPATIDYCRRNGAPLDFISTHHYPTDDPLWKNSELTMEEFYRLYGNKPGQYERGILRKMTERAREEAGDLPLYYTEWNISAHPADPPHDEAYAAALVLKTIADNDGLVEGYSFWTFSDLFEEGGQASTPFHGGFGLLNLYGIPKPTYRVFELLHALGDRRIEVAADKPSSVEVLAVKAASRLNLLVYNHDIPGSELRTEEVTLILKGLKSAKPALVSRIDEGSANPKRQWEELGSPVYPDRAQLDRIERASRPSSGELTPVVEPDTDAIRLRISVPPHGIVALTVEL